MKTFLFLSTAFYLTCLFSEEVPIIELDPMVIRPDRLGNALFENIEEPSTAVFDFQPSVWLNQIAGLSGRNELIVRGAEPNFTKIYVEGIEVNDPTDPTGNGFEFTRFGNGLVGAVTLLTGPYSAQHGSDAMGGTLSLTFDSSSNLHSNFRSDYQLGNGGYESRTIKAGIPHKNLSFSAGWNDQIENELYPDTSFESETYFVKVSVDTARIGDFTWSAWENHTEKIALPDDSGGPLYAVLKEMDRKEFDSMGISLIHRKSFGAKLYLESKLAYYLSESDLDSAAIAPGPRSPFGVPANNFDNKYKKRQIESFIRHSFASANGLDVVLGFSHTKETGESKGVIYFPFGNIPSNYEEERSTSSGFFETEVAFEKHSIQFAQRVDKASGFSAQWTPSIQWSFNPNHAGYSLKARYSEGFKVPGMFALFNPIVGNPELLPEKVRSWELNWSDQFLDDALEFRANLFYQKYRNLIDMSETEQRLINLSKVNSKGLEVIAAGKLAENLVLETSFTHLDIETGEEGEVLRNRPENIWNSRLTYHSTEGYRIYLQYNYTGSRWDSSIPTGNRQMDSYANLNFGFDFSFREQFHFKLLLSNILNDKDERHIGYADPGMGYRISGSVSF
ncbi:MAG: TonB-dependent receptor [Opitutales bacterium]|nr:TonB-dependent receptor [Opitutales bacterium]